MTICPVCHQEKRVIVTSWIVVNGRKHEWSQCASCEVRERRLQDGRAMVAIEEAERSGV